MRKGQVTMEFIMIATFMMFLFAGLFFALQERVSVMRETESYEVMSQLGNLVATEVRMAGKIGEGYERDFNVPTTLYGRSYNIQVEDDWDLVIEYENREYITFLDLPINGTLSKGRNTIKCCKMIGGVDHVVVS